MRRPSSEDGFLFTSSRFGLLRSGVPERDALLWITPHLLVFLRLATLIHLGAGL